MGDSPTIPALLPLRCGVADLDRGLVHRAGEAIELTPNERAVLATLAARADLVVPREALLAAALGYSPQAVTRTLDMTVRRLRAKIELRPATPEQVLTERGAGYRFVPTPPSGAFSVGEAPIIGRQDELLAMSTGLTDARLLTLVGPAGVGKTRLAQAFADLHAGGFATLGGAWFVDLTDALDEPALIAAVCEALRLEVPADRAQAESRLQARLAALGPALLVLDNFEQLVWSASPRVQRWLAAAPDLRVLVASREALGVAGERVLAIAPLPLADACALLARLAPQSAAGDPALVALAGAVDRLPLMLHLAAGRLAEADADAVTAALARDPATLDPASRLDAAIRSSWNLLIEPERAALAALSVFRGGLPSDGAEAVLGPNWTGLLGVLVDKSLVARAGARHRLLLAVRTFAAARLDERGERTGAELRHA
ncbi:MAG: winged helix-turn-helix domain-containing protein, partial [Myxococcales bacterium]|nr:winged helix-turn-helix domain-containing protein [Myxococcales bacterium]